MTTEPEGGEGSASHLGHFLPPENTGTYCTGGWVGPRAGLDRCGKSRLPTGFRYPDRPARSQSLYWLRYPAHMGPIGCHKSLQTTTSLHCVTTQKSKDLCSEFKKENVTTNTLPQDTYLEGPENSKSNYIASFIFKAFVSAYLENTIQQVPW